MSCKTLDVLPELTVGDNVPFYDLVGVGVHAWYAEGRCIRIACGSLLEDSEMSPEWSHGRLARYRCPWP